MVVTVKNLLLWSRNIIFWGCHKTELQVVVAEVNLLYLSQIRISCSCRGTEFTVMVKEQNFLWLSQNRTSCSYHSKEFTCSGQRTEIPVVPQKRTSCSCHRAAREVGKTVKSVRKRSKLRIFIFIVYTNLDFCSPCCKPVFQLSVSRVWLI